MNLISKEMNEFIDAETQKRMLSIDINVYENGVLTEPTTIEYFDTIIDIYIDTKKNNTKDLRLFTPDEVSTMLKISKNTLALWRTRNHKSGLDYIKIGALVRYPSDSIQKYLNRQLIEIKKGE